MQDEPWSSNEQKPKLGTEGVVKAFHILNTRKFPDTSHDQFIVGW